MQNEWYTINLKTSTFANVRGCWGSRGAKIPTQNPMLSELPKNILRTTLPETNIAPKNDGFQ